ncbi:DNA-directed DNA polymerase II small subunit [Halorubrum sp. CGM4_25_10-8A]|uniref:DNA-directed DNA polymerase II small subunit n=1 Tax=Halorubrum sp. CGM4_25_10-8A TaxID=2518116 RepID=UPI0010F4CA65|nr:DNA-directed DNA polymerase II small subunit [Halorubrum sp. CGM4_25_10-8A]TKX36066.1 DNA-directed DNA polymerase II small subunit [Halorubrum sp. CGM4_25_10-8A]
MPLESNARIAKALAERGYNAEREAVTLLAGATDPTAAIAATVDRAPDEALRITADHVREAIDHTDKSAAPPDETGQSPVETKGSSATEPGATETVADPVTTDGASAMDVDTGAASDPATADTPTVDPTTTDSPTADSATAADTSRDLDLRDLEVGNDMTGRSTGTGEYSDFVTTFRDRYERLSKVLRGRVNHRPAEAIANMPGGSDAAMIGLVNDVRSTKSGHWLVELEDTTGTFPALVMKDKGLADVVDEILLDECVAVEGTLADDAGILFADSLHFPDVPRTHNPGGADRHVQAALISDVHVGSDEFMADAWHSFADWLHTPEADPVEYILLAGDMVEGVGVYPDQDEELDIVDIYEQYEAFAEHLKEVPADTEIVMIPGNHDAVRLAEPQPGFNDEIRAIMDVHDARIVSNPATVSVEGVEVLMYHGVSLDEVIAELPEEKASYDEPHKAMYQLLKKRHVAPQFGGHTRVAPEERDYLVIEDVPDVFHTGHVHKLGWGKYHNVLAVNSGCWQAQTDFQKSVNIDPDAGYAPILDLDTLDMTVRKFS